MDQKLTDTLLLMKQNPQCIDANITNWIATSGKDNSFVAFTGTYLGATRWKSFLRK